MQSLQSTPMAHEAEEYPAMSESTTDIRIVPLPTGQDVLSEVLRDGARRMLAQAVEAEVATWIDAHAHLKDEAGRQQVVRNGHLPERTIQTGIGNVEVKQPRIRDRRPADEREPFTSAILPPYLRKTKSLEGLIPWLYLKGVSTGDFAEALQALLGPDAPGLSAATVTRLKAAWEAEHEAWAKRSLKGKRYVDVRADGVHFDIRLEGGRQCILVLMGATAEGKKELIAIADGYRESEQSWKELLLDCKARGLEIEPALAIGDGALGFWKAMRPIWDTTREQRCWVHKTAVAVGTTLAGSPPRRSGRAELPHPAPTSGEGGDAAWPHSAHDDERSTRRSGSGSGTRPPTSGSPWSTAFPPPPPQTDRLRRCSAASQVLRSRPTSHGRTCWADGFWPSPADPGDSRRWVPLESPVSRAKSFHACSGSPTARGPRAACQ